MKILRFSPAFSILLNELVSDPVFFKRLQAESRDNLIYYFEAQVCAIDDFHEEFLEEFSDEFEEDLGLVVVG